MIHFPEQGNHCPNFHLNLPSNPEVSNQAQYDLINPLKPPTVQTQANSPLNYVKCRILPDSYVPKQGNPSTTFTPTDVLKLIPKYPPPSKKIPTTTPELSEQLHPPQMAFKQPLSDFSKSYALLNNQNPFDPTKIKVSGYNNEPKYKIMSFTPVDSSSTANQMPPHPPSDLYYLLSPKT